MIFVRSYVELCSAELSSFVSHDTIHSRRNITGFRAVIRESREFRGTCRKDLLSMNATRIYYQVNTAPISEKSNCVKLEYLGKDSHSRNRTKAALLVHDVKDWPEWSGRMWAHRDDQNDTAEKPAILGDFRAGVLTLVTSRHILIPT